MKPHGALYGAGARDETVAARRRRRRRRVRRPRAWAWPAPPTRRRAQAAGTASSPSTTPTSSTTTTASSSSPASTRPTTRTVVVRRARRVIEGGRGRDRRRRATSRCAPRLRLRPLRHPRRRRAGAGALRNALGGRRSPDPERSRWPSTRSQTPVPGDLLPAPRARTRTQYVERGRRRSTAGDTIGLVEIMKNFQEIEAEAAGKLVEYLVDNEEDGDRGPGGRRRRRRAMKLGPRRQPRRDRAPDGPRGPRPRARGDRGPQRGRRARQPHVRAGRLAPWRSARRRRREPTWNVERHRGRRTRHAARTRCIPGYGFLAERAELRRGVRGRRPALRRPGGRAHRAHGRQGPRARGGRGTPACPPIPGTDGRGGRRRTRPCAVGGGVGCPVAIKAAGGRRRAAASAWLRDEAELRRGSTRPRAREAQARLRRRRGCTSSASSRAPATWRCRCWATASDAVHLRRAGLLAAAAPSEGGRGDACSGPAGRACARELCEAAVRAVRRGRLPQRRHASSSWWTPRPASSSSSR